jgi:hypothetical protein
LLPRPPQASFFVVDATLLLPTKTLLPLHEHQVPSTAATAATDATDNNDDDNNKDDNKEEVQTLWSLSLFQSSS